MKPLYTELEYLESKSKDKLPCECYYCKSIFHTTKRLIKQELKENRNRIKYCSPKCSSNHQTQKYTKIVKCKNCNIEFVKHNSQIKLIANNFCSKSCSAIYNNKHKTHGYRRSKLEIWLEEQLTILYPNLEIHYNRKDTILSELDMYIPLLNIAFELNGVFHYEPIFGNDKLGKIQLNDISKSKACHDAKIDLCIIDTSSQKYVKPSTSQKYLDIIINIINERLLTI